MPLADLIDFLSPLEAYASFELRVLCVTQFAVYHKTIMPSLHMIVFHLGQQNQRPPGKTKRYFFVICSFKVNSPSKKQQTSQTPTKIGFLKHFSTFPPCPFWWFSPLWSFLGLPTAPGEPHLAWPSPPMIIKASAESRCVKASWRLGGRIGWRALYPPGN